MPQHRRYARTAVMLAALLLVPAFAQAQTKGHSAEVGIACTFTHFDSQTDLEYRLSPSVMVGYNFTKRHGAEMVFTSTTATPRKLDPFNVDVDVLRIGYVFSAQTKPKLTSFFRLGLGVWTMDPEPSPDATQRLEESETDLMIYTGGGFRLFLNERLAIRVAGSFDYIDAGNGAAHGDVQATGDIGLIFVMGGRDAVEPPPAEQPKP